MTNRTLVQETCTNPGTGTTVNLNGAVSSRRSFASSFSNGQTCFYVLSDGLISEWGIGTFSTGSPNTLSRTTVLGNSAGTTSRLNFTGTTNVYNAVPAEYSSFMTSDWGGTAGGSANALTCTIPLPLPATLPSGLRGYLVANATNTGNVTLSVNGTTAAPLRLYNGLEVPPNAIWSGDLIEWVRVGSEYRICDPSFTSLTALSTVNLASGGSTSDFTLDSRYRRFEFAGTAVYSSSTNFQISARVSRDGGATYDAGASDYYDAYSFQSNSLNAGSLITSSILISESIVANGPISFTSSITPGDGAFGATIFGNSASINPANTAFTTGTFSGYRNATGRATNLRFVGSQVFAGGVLTLYGARV